MIYKYDLNGDASSKTAVSLGGPTVVDVIDHAIEIDFGSGGIGGSPNTTAADGYYEVDIKLPSGYGRRCTISTGCWATSTATGSSTRTT